jgi:hypothetical protein
MALLAPLVGQFAGVEKRAIIFAVDGMNRSVNAGELVDRAITGVLSLSKEGEPTYLDKTAHPVSVRLALANVTRSDFKALGIEWDDTSSTRNGHFAPFSWAG